jgi:hypothetical protein
MNPLLSIFEIPTDSPSWLLQHGIELLVFLLGLLMGLVFVIAGWRGPATRDVSLKNDPRVKALLYGLGGFFTALIADWKTLLGQGVNKTWLIVLYGVPFVLVAFAGPFVIAVVIFFRLSWLKYKRPEECPGQPFYLAFDYFAYGYRYHKDEYDRLMEVARTRSQAERLAHLRSLRADADTSLAALILSPSPNVPDVLRIMCSIFAAHTEASEIPEVNANLMVAIPFSRASEEQKNLLKFVFGDTNRYGHLLWLREYAYDRGEGSIALPVEDPIHTPSWLELVLLGAPEAFLRRSETVVNTKNLDFAPKIPETVRRQMRMYFKGKGFKSFACLTVIGKGAVIGIVNIESSHELGSDEIQNEIAKRLQPFCAVLSQILQKEA